MRDLLILGYSGSIGTQALEVVENQSLYCLKGVSCRSSTQEIPAVLSRFPTLERVAVAELSATIDDGSTAELKEVLHGPQAASQLIERYPGAVVLNATVGIAGLAMTLKAIEKDCTLLLANKESLFVGGDLILDLLKKHRKARIIPVDSEHSALDKLLSGREERVEELLITCSGGALRDLPLEQLEEASAQTVLRHPTWRMGPRITVDCATMVNKAYEVIEAHYLFGFPLARIKVVMHDESRIHAMLKLEDHTVIAEMGPSDMRIPLSYALNLRKRVSGDFDELEPAKALHFRAFDPQRYPAFNFIVENFKPRSSNQAVINAADEVAVSAFLAGQIKFTEIEAVIRCTFRRVREVEVKTLEDVEAISARASRAAEEVVEEIQGEK